MASEAECHPRLRLNSSAPATAFDPPPHSIAVLPFINMSGDKEQEYFSDGLTEELIDPLAPDPGSAGSGTHLHVLLQGQDPDMATVAHQLNVGACSKAAYASGNTCASPRSWSCCQRAFTCGLQTYDRDLGDVLWRSSDRDCHSRGGGTEDHAVGRLPLSEN